MMVQTTSTASNTNTMTPQSTIETDGLGRDAFLQLLVTQMRHQDPLDPVDNSQFMSDLAQFASLERLEHLVQQTASMQQMYAMSLLGKQVTLFDNSQATVTSVHFQSGMALLQLADDRVIELNQIVSVTQPPAGTSA